MAIVSSNSCSLSDMLCEISDHSKSSPQLSGHLELSICDSYMYEQHHVCIGTGIFTFLVVEFFPLMVCHKDVYLHV